MNIYRLLGAACAMMVLVQSTLSLTENSACIDRTEKNNTMYKACYNYKMLQKLNALHGICEEMAFAFTFAASALCVLPPGVLLQ